MKFCTNCGGQIPEGTAFCPTCGAAVAQDANQQAQAQTQQPGQQYAGPQPNVGGANDVTTDKGAAILSYLGFLSLIALYVMKPQTQFGQFHAKQGVNLFIIDMIVSVGGSIIRGILNSIGVPFVGSLIGLISTAIWVLSIVGLIWAAQGKMEKLPVVGDIKIVK